MRILVLTNLYPNPGDRNRAPFNRQQFRALAALHPVRVIAPIGWVEELAAWRHGATRLASTRQVVNDGITVDHPRYWYPPRCLRPWHGHFYQASVRTVFRRAVDEFRPDIVLGSWAYPDGWSAVRLAHEASLPAVIKVHGCDLLWGLRHNTDRQSGTREALRAADAVVAVSSDLANEVVRFGVQPERVRVIYHGVDSTVFYPGPQTEARAKLELPPHERLLLFVGALVAVKGVDVLLTACARLRQAGQPFMCRILGDGPMRAALEKQARDLGIADQVCFLGSRPHHELGDWYRAANIFVLPSRSEGVPGVLLEAMACGIPFVASRVGGTSEVSHLGVGRLVPSDDPDALALGLAEQLTAQSSPPRALPFRDYGQSAAELADWLTTVLHRRALPTLSTRRASRGVVTVADPR